MRSAAPSSTAARSSSPSIRRVKKSTPTARTSGAASGSSMSPRGSRVAIARPAAIIVAVEPTLEARSQVSSSVRAIEISLGEGGDDRHRVTHRIQGFGIRVATTVVGEDLRAGAGADLPAVITQILPGRGAFAGVEQLREVDVEAVLSPRIADDLAALTERLAPVGVVLGGQAAARGGQRSDRVEQLVL